MALRHIEWVSYLGGMREEQLFAAALGLPQPWTVTRVEFLDSATEEHVKELHIEIGYTAGSRFTVEGESCSVYDHQQRTWRHLNFFQHVCYLHCRVPRVKTSDGSVRLVDVPWAGAGSSFTLLFEAYAMLLVHSGMSLASAGRYVQQDGRVIGRMIRRRVWESMSEQPLEQVHHLGVDETSLAKGHHYFTVLTDLNRKKVVGLAEGKDTAAMESAVEEMVVRGSTTEGVKVVTQDLSAAYTAGTNKCMPQAKKVYDRYHITALLNKAVDEVRKADTKDNDILKKTKYLWLYNGTRLSDEQAMRVAMLSEACPNIGTAYRLKEQFRLIWEEEYKGKGVKALKAWMTLARNSGLKQFEKFVTTLEKHWEGIITYFRLRLTNGFVERVNLKIQEIKRLARGYRSISNFKAMIYFQLGGLQLGLPTIDGR